MTAIAQGSRATVVVNGKTISIPTDLFINNQFVPAASGKRFETVNPSSGKVICTVAEADRADVDIAVKAAETAFNTTWSHMSPEKRGKLLFKLADLLERDADIFAHIETMDNGKPYKVSLESDVAGTISHIRYYAGWTDKIHGKVIENGDSLHMYTRHEPFGVVGAIIPWNFPLVMMAWKLGPALACGNTIIIKTSEKTPLTALKLGELIVEAGFPPGVINILSGYGPTAGSAIASHMGIRKVAFTGSTPTGRIIMKLAAESNLKKVSLELGGKSPNIVFADADLDNAVKWSVSGIFENCGQVCSAGSRIFVQEEIYDTFIQKFKEKTNGLRVGNPFENNVDLGPLVDRIQYDRVSSYLKIGAEEGAECYKSPHPLPSQGYFTPPTVFTSVTDNMKISREEIFGPVAVIMKFKTIDEVVARANDTEYGLGSAIHTTNATTATKVGRELKAGVVWVNCYGVFTDTMPFGGFKQSGMGRECGEDALQEYTQIKAIVQHLA